MNVNRARVNWYRFSYGCHRLTWPVRWLTLSFAFLALIEFFVFVRFPNHFLNPVSPFALALINLAFRIEVAWVVVFGLPALISAWFNVWFRYAAWWVVKYWRSGLVIVIAATLIIWRQSLGTRLLAVLQALFVLGVLLKVAAAILILLLLYGAYRARGRLVILPFANYTGDDTLKCCVEGLAPLLLNELGRLVKLYSEVEDASLAEKSRRVSDRGLPATISVEDVGDVLQSAVTPQSLIKFWGIEIPVGSLLRLFGQLARGPRVSGSLHKEGERLVLLASIDGGRQPAASWRVSPEDLPEALGSSGTDLVGRMMDQLAYRVFADRVPSMSQRWQAVRCYAEGLRVLRITTRTKKDKEANLRQAERAFQQALAEDNKFARNHYNLGIVYTALGEPLAAQAAFYQAVKEDPNLTEAYYAIALDAWNRQDYSNALGYCDQVIAQQPSFARAWDLKGLTERKLQEQRFGPLKAGEHKEVWPDILASREIGAALAWRALCRAEIRGRSLDETRDVAARCVRGVAVAHAMMLKFSRAASTMEQALYLAPGDADLHFELGKMLTNPAAGASHFTTATRIDPRQALYWAFLAESLGRLFANTRQESFRQDARSACERVMDYSSGTDVEAQDKLWAALKAIGDDNEIRAAWEHTRDCVSGTEMDKRGLNKLRAAIEAIREDKDIPAACERATGYLSGTDKVALERLRAAIELIGKDDKAVRATCDRAINYAPGTDKNALEKLRAALEVIDKEEFRAACERAKDHASGRDKKALDKLQKSLEVAAQEDVRAACERTMNYVSGADKEAQDKLREALQGKGKEARIVSPIPQFLGQLVQGNEDLAAYLTRLTALENWLALVMLFKNLSGQYGRWEGWAYGQVAGTLAQNLVQTDPTRAQRLAERAIQCMSGQHQGAIRELGLNGTLAQAFLNQGKPELRPQALLFAERAVAMNPERAWERSILAEVYSALGEYERVEAELRTCLDLSPESGYWTRIATSHWQRGVSLRNPVKRKEAFQSVIEFFGRALKIIESTNLKKDRLGEQIADYGSIHYWTGRFHHELFECDDAVTHLQAAKNMGYKPLESIVYLGWVHMEAKNYDAAEASFREALSRVRDQQKQGRQLSESDSGLGEEMSMNELLIMTYLLWSFSYSDRGARLSMAEQLTNKTRWLIQQLDASKAQQYESTRFDCLGYAQLRMGRVDEAAKEFERSLALSVDAGACVRLAEAYRRQATTDKTLQDSCVAKALECCARARDVDLRQQYGQRIKDLEDRLGALAKPTG